MNEVEKMYSNSGIVKCNRLLKPCPFNNECNDCEHNWYPEFTAEKQLELIKWLGIRDEFNFYQNKVTKDFIFYDHEKDATHYNFELGLASWVNYIWQDLTDTDKAQIKEILE